MKRRKTIKGKARRAWDHLTPSIVSMPLCIYVCLSNLISSPITHPISLLKRFVPTIVPILCGHKSFVQMDHQVDIGPLHSVNVGNQSFWHYPNVLLGLWVFWLLEVYIRINFVLKPPPNTLSATQTSRSNKLQQRSLTCLSSILQIVNPTCKKNQSECETIYLDYLNLIWMINKYVYTNQPGLQIYIHILNEGARNL